MLKYMLTSFDYFSTGYEHFVNAVKLPYN